MIDNAPTPAPESTVLPPLPRAPWLLMASTLAVLFLFGIVIYFMYQFSDSFANRVPDGSDDEVRELRESENKRLQSYGYDPELKTYHLPIDQAMQVLAREAEANRGELKSLPMPKRALPPQPKK